jgi:hypothetical protein
MKRNVVLAAGLALALATAACNDQKNELTAPPAGTPEAQQSIVKQFPTSLRVSDVGNPSRIVDPEAGCNDLTPITQYFLNRAFEIPIPTLIMLVLDNEHFADQVPTYESLIFQTKATPQYFGYNGEYNQRMAKTEKDVKRFWDIKSDDIQVLAMHGTVLLNKARTVPTYKSNIFTGYSAARAETDAEDVRQAVLTTPAIKGGNHPLFTFNAFAISAPEIGIPDKIVMGDGILDGYKAVGFDDVALPAIFAHEFGHHIQYERGYFEELPPGSNPATVDQAELTRYTELMADAFSAYYLTHSRGASMNRKRVAQFLQVFFQIGDCAFSSPGHHGTPTQRMRAANFGFDVADQAQKQGHILTAAQFHALFLAKYTTFVS